MYRKLEPLEFSRHADLRLLPVRDYQFARAELTAPIVIDEIADIAREYPIVFPLDADLPVALLGVQRECNAYLSPNGNWRASYVPARIRQYPLAVMDRRPDPAKANGHDRSGPVLVLDEEAAGLSRLEGDPVFEDDGELRGAALERARLARQWHSRLAPTRRLVAAIDAAGLLVARAIRIRTEDQSDRHVTGLRAIDEAALNAMEAGPFHSLRATGALPLIYAALLSWANFRQGPIGKSHMLPKGEAKSDLIAALVS